MKAGWQSTRLGEVYDVRDGTHDSPQYHLTGFPLITSKNLKQNGLDFDDIKLISEDDYRKINARSVVHIGDVLFAMIGTIGNPTVVRMEPNFAIKNVALFKLNSSQNSNFLKYYLDSPIVISKMKLEAKGTTQKFVGLGYLRDFPINLPPLPEQQRIVTILDEAFEGIATATANAKKNLANARELFESYLQSVFASKKDGWKEVALGEVCKFEGGSQPPKNLFEYTYKEGLIRLIQIRDYKSDKNVVYIPLEKAKRFCNENEIMIGRYGPPVFQILRGLKGAYNVALMKAIPDKKIVTDEFMFFLLQHPAIQKYVISLSERAVGQTGISRDDLEAYRIYYPDLEIQSKLTDNIITLSNETKKLEAIYQQKLTALEELKKSILNQAFSGQLN